MKVAVVGGNGRVGRMVLQKLKLLSSEFDPVSIIRSDRQTSWFADKGIKTKVLSLEDDVDTLSLGLKGQDAIVFTAAASCHGTILSIDLDGAVKMMEVAQLMKIKRFVIVSAMQVDNREYWYNNPYRDYFIAKRAADHELMTRDDLDWTILRPGNFSGGRLGEGTGKVTDVPPPGYGIKIDDVASSVVEALRHDNTIHKIITLYNGDIPILDFMSKF